MRTLTSAERRALRAKAHHLQPVVSIGNNGLTRSVLHEIDVNLTAHELVKVRVFNDDRQTRERLFAEVCTELDAAPVQRLGKILMLWRPAPAPDAISPASKKKAAETSGSRRGAHANPRRRLRTAGNSRSRQA
ncbi:MAG TPA: YhbY family RNA-binding protein [Casimicrobiaceae bacterium]|nr:YhbY family RNA-binding protein [Casimicrobiaceae bacterium]